MKSVHQRKIVIKNKDKKKKYTFKSNKKKIAKVSKSGKVTAVKKGNAKITVKETVKKKKARKLGVVKVTVNAKSDIPAVQNTVTPVNNQPLATPAGTANSTNLLQSQQIHLFRDRLWNLYTVHTSLMDLLLTEIILCLWIIL